MKKSLFGMLMAGILFSLVLGVPHVCFTGEPPPCGPTGYTLVGPPVVGTGIIDYVSGDPPSVNVSVDITGCCADCFGGRCNSSCNVKIQFLDVIGVMPENIPADQLQGLNLLGRAPKNCFSKEGGEDLVITDILKSYASDIDKDGVKEFVADIVMFYWKCNQ